MWVFASPYLAQKSIHHSFIIEISFQIARDFFNFFNISTNIDMSLSIKIAII